MLILRRSTHRLTLLTMIAVLAFNAVAVQPALAADPPSVLSVTRVDTRSTSAAGSVDFTVTFSVPVQGVDAADFGLAAGSIVDAAISGVSGGAGDAVYTVTVSTGTGVGTVGVDVKNDGTITDMNDPAQPLSGPFSGGETYQIRIPLVQSITRLDANPTSKLYVRYQVTFTDPVVGVNIGTASDFALPTTGVAGAQIWALGGTGAIYTVTVKTANGNGQVGLNALDDDTIRGPNGGRYFGDVGLGNGAYPGPFYQVKKIPVPAAPAGTIWDTTPTFRWSTVPRATQYQFEVYKGTTRLYLQNVLATACTTTACLSTPATVLPPGPYKWRVSAKIDAAWKPWSAYKSFTTAIGFNSQFNGNATGWVQRPGAPWTIGSTMYSTPGLLEKTSTASYNKSFANFTYQARMRRLGIDMKYGNRAGLIVRGTPTFNAYNDWNKGYLFAYSSLWQLYTVWKVVGGTWTPLVWWTYSPALVQSDWNTLKVVASGSTFKYYVNGTLVWSGKDSSIASGQVALWTWSGGSAAERLDVDWATLTTLP